MGPLIILSGPSGCGKSTIIRRLLDEAAWSMRLSVSATTRRPRLGEVAGVHYWFWQPADFVQAIDEGKFLEWAEVHGNYYGSLASEVKPYREKGIGVLLDIDVQGREQVVQRCTDAVSIFIRTSTIDMIEQRLRDRHTETEDAIQRRLLNARAELARADQYDYQVINDDLETALAAMRAILGPLFSASRAP
jgi:guanylate kinase